MKELALLVLIILAGVLAFADYVCSIGPSEAVIDDIFERTMQESRWYP